MPENLEVGKGDPCSKIALGCLGLLRFFRVLRLLGFRVCPRIGALFFATLMGRHCSYEVGRPSLHEAMPCKVNDSVNHDHHHAET